MKAQDILNTSLKQASKAGRSKKKWKEADLARLNTAHSIANSFLNEFIKKTSTPLTEFQKHLIETMINAREKNQEIQKIKASIRILKKLKQEYEIKIKFADNPKQSSKLLKEYFGRFSSVIKKIKINEIQNFIKKLKKLPEIKQMPTIIIAGYPNVGKSQLLKTMSKQKIKTASYPFTTKELLIAYIKERFDKIQVIDTPGILDRPIEKRNKIEKKAILALKYLSKNVLFLIDSSETCGYNVKEQLNLMNEIKKQFKPKIL